MISQLGNFIDKANSFRSALIDFFAASLSFLPTKLEKAKVEYMIITYLSVPIACIFPFIHGRNKRQVLDFLLGFILIYLANGKWTFLLIVMAMVGYIYAHLPIPSITLKSGKKIDIRTISVVGLSMIYTTFIHRLYTSTKDRPEGPILGEFYFNTCMILVMKIGYLSRRKEGEKISIPNWLTYCFTVNGSLSGMAVKYSHWEEWIEEKNKESKLFMRKKSLIKALVQTGIGSLWSFGFLILFDIGMKQVDSMDLIKYNLFASEHGITNRFIITALNLGFLGITAFAHRCMYYIIWVCFWAAICGSQFALKEIKTRAGGDGKSDVQQLVDLQNRRAIRKMTRQGRREQRKKLAINLNDCFSSPEISRVETDTMGEISFQSYYSKQQQKLDRKIQRKQNKLRRKEEKRNKNKGTGVNGEDGGEGEGEGEGEDGGVNEVGTNSPNVDQPQLKDDEKGKGKGNTQPKKGGKKQNKGRKDSNKLSAPTPIIHTINTIVPAKKPLVPLDFTRDKNIDPVRIELSTTMTEIVFYWNALAAKYWRDAVFRPLMGLGFPAHISMVVTNTVSAMWHGCTPGFLAFFWLATLAMLGARPGWKLVRPGVMIPAEEAQKKLSAGTGSRVRARVLAMVKMGYNFVCHFITKSILQANEIPFILLSYGKVMDYLRRIYYYPVWVPMVLYLLNTLVWFVCPYFRRYSKLAEERKASRRKNKVE